MMGPILLAVPLVILLAVLAIRLSRRSGLDGPARLLTWAVRGLPEDRRPWGEAMLAELHALQGKAERWRFAISCARAALFAPQRLRLDALALLMLTGIAGILAFAGYVLIAYPTGRHPVHTAIWDGRSPVLLTVFAVLLSGYLVMILKPPSMLRADSTARSAAMLSGILFVLGSTVAGQVDYLAGLVVFVLAPMLILPLCAAVVAGRTGSARNGVLASVWASLVIAVLGFTVFSLPTLLRVNLNASMRDDFEGVEPYAVDVWYSSVLGQGLGTGIMDMILYPVWGIFFGLIGAGAGRLVTRRS